jgi:hypothetical protein
LPWPDEAGETLRVLLKYFKDPIKHLSIRFSTENLSLLHQAVNNGNVPAVKALLEPNRGFDRTLQDSQGFTAFDHVLRRFVSLRQNREFEFWDVPFGGQREIQPIEAYEKPTYDMIEHFKEDRLGATKGVFFTHVFKKRSTNIVETITIDPTGEGYIGHEHISKSTTIN